MVAWIVTMEPGEHEVITILNYRLSGKRVGKIIEQLYVDQRMDLGSRLAYAKTGQTRCPAKYALVDEVPYGEELWCGSGDRFFWARKVDDLKVIVDKAGNEKLVWKERKRPDLSKIRELFGTPVPDESG